MEYKKLFTLSFDDGVTQDERFISILNKYNIKCTFNLNSELFGKDGFLTIDDKRINHTKVPKNRVSQIYQGHEVASHTLTHPFLPDATVDEIVRQVEEDRKNLSDLVGYNVRGFAYPGGGVNHNIDVSEVIKNNTQVEYARTTVPTYNFDLQKNLYIFNPTTHFLRDKEKLLSLWDEFENMKTEEIKLFYVWGHTYEFDVNDDWGFLEEFCKRISGKTDVYYCTNIQAFDYIKSKNI